MTEVLVGALPGPAKPVPIPATSASRVLFGPGALVAGWALMETSGTAPASLVLVNGQDATGTIVVPVTLTAGQSTRDYLAGGGVLFDSGVFLRVVSGSVSGSVWVVPL